MNYIRHSFPYAAMRQHIRPSVGLRSPGPAFSRRCFASEKPSGQAKNPRWLVSILTYATLIASDLHFIALNRLLVSIGLGLPISIYLWQRGDTKKPSSKPHTQPRGANQEYSQESEATQAGVQNIKSGSSGGDVVCYSFFYCVVRAWFALSSFNDPGYWENAYLTFT